jgi:DNA invertase Pin-like site-specific DNA recombinase
MALIGYARVSTREQNPESQEAALRAAGAEKIFTDHGESSHIANRPQWIACLDYMRTGDTLMIRALDRIAGSERMAIETIRELGEQRIKLHSLTEPFLDIDASTPMGEAIIGIMAVLAQLRVSTIRENTRKGLEHARAQGRVGGRPTVMAEERVETAKNLRAESKNYPQIARTLGVSISSVQRALSSAK